MRMHRFSLAITAGPEDIDEMGHVNNAVWVKWIQDVATAHWMSDALQEHRDAWLWVVVRHEIDYRGNVREGETVIGETWIQEPPKGARFDRYMRFTGSDGKVKVESKTSWALVDRVTGRIARVPTELAANFLP